MSDTKAHLVLNTYCMKQKGMNYELFLVQVRLTLAVAPDRSSALVNPPPPLVVILVRGMVL